MVFDLPIEFITMLHYIKMYDEVTVFKNNKAYFLEFVWVFCTKLTDYLFILLHEKRRYFSCWFIQHDEYNLKKNLSNYHLTSLSVKLMSLTCLCLLFL